MEKSGAHRRALPAKFKPGNGDFDRSPPALHPPFMRCREGVRVAFYRCAFFIGRFVSSWARDSNRPAANAPVELIILRLRVWRFSATRP